MNPPAKKSFFSLVKESFSSKDENTIFPWYQAGLILLGFTLGAFITLSVDVISRYNRETTTNTVASDKVEECQNKGGRYNSQSQNCLLVTEDRGSGCSSNDECNGWCIADSNAKIGTSAKGKCSESYNQKGCVKFIDNGLVNEVCLP